MKLCNSCPKVLPLFISISVYMIVLSFAGPGFCKDYRAEKIKKGSYITSGSYTGGEFADGLDVKSIRWADHRGFERLVFDIYKWGGPTRPEGLLPNDYPGAFRFTVDGENRINARFEGYRAFTAKPPDFSKSKVIEQIELHDTEQNTGDSGYSFTIVLKHPAKLEVFELYSPARIVVDLKPISK